MMFNKGVVLAGARQLISHNSPVFNSWKRGNFKPVGVQSLQFVWEVWIEYFDILEEIEEPQLIIRYFNYGIRDEAVSFRDRTIKNIERDGKTVKNVSIRLVRRK